MSSSSTSYSSTSTTKGSSITQSQSTGVSQSTSQKVIDEKLRDEILAGLLGYMTDAEIDAYAESLLKPTLDAELEASQQKYDTARLGREQEIEGLASALARGIAEQERIHAKNAAGVQTAALARGMGRSSYTLQALANEAKEHARIVGEMTEESGRRRGDLQEQITLAGEQNAKTQGRLNVDYAKALAAKVQELREKRRSEYNSHYLSAVSGSMGSVTNGTSSSSGKSETASASTTQTKGSTSTSSSGSSSRSSSKKNTDDIVDAVSSAAPKPYY